MNLYAHDLSLLDFSVNFPDSEAFSHRQFATSFNSGVAYNYDDDDEDLALYGNGNYGGSRNNRVVPDRPPPKHRHDGTSPLPMGMDWSLPPRKWEGRDSIWPHDPHTGWSYCVMIPSWTFLRKSRSSDPVVFYRVQVGIQSPEGVTTSRGVLRRFNEFLNLFSELKKTFPMKQLPPAPPKRLLRVKSQELLEERRCSLEDWMEKLLSDIDVSRSLPIAMFLELEAAVRSSFHNVGPHGSEYSSTSGALLQANSDVSIVGGSSSITSDQGDETPYEISELGTPKAYTESFTDFGMEKSTSEQDLIDSLESDVKIGMFNTNFVRESLQRLSGRKMPNEIEGSVVARDQVIKDSTDAKPLRLDGTEFFTKLEDYQLDGHSRKLSAESDLSSVRASEISNLIGYTDLPGGSGAPRNADTSIDSDLQSSRDLLLALPSDERHKLNRILITLQRRLVTTKTDMEDLIARFNQEVAVRQFLTTKVKDLEVELETTSQSCKENMQQTVLTEKERFNQMQWDMEELRRKCMELELKLKSEQEEKLCAESTKASIVEENKMLLQELDVAREHFDNLQKHHEDFELKTKTDLKLLVKEVKSLRSTQSELKQELSRVMKEKLEAERVLQKEKQRNELADAANVKLLHECEILQSRLRECSVNFLVEEEDQLIIDSSLPSDAVDILTTSDNRIGLLLAEAQLLAQDMENGVRVADEHLSQSINGGDKRKSDDELRKMLTDILVDNARLRKQVNSVIRCALNTNARTETDDEDDETPLRNTVLSKFLER